MDPESAAAAADRKRESGSQVLKMLTNALGAFESKLHSTESEA